jgi:hypothetical protein
MAPAKESDLATGRAMRALYRAIIPTALERETTNMKRKTMLNEIDALSNFLQIERDLTFKEAIAILGETHRQFSLAKKIIDAKGALRKQKGK